MSAPATLPLEAGSLIRISNPARGAVNGEIIDVRTPAELPSLSRKVWGKLQVAAVRRILAEWRVTRCALVGYRYGAKDVAFFALEINGRWYDLKRQELTLEVLA